MRCRARSAPMIVTTSRKRWPQQGLETTTSGKLCRSTHSADDLVDEAPAPDLARLERAHHRVLSVAEMPGRVPAWRRVAASHVPACQAEPQVYPVVAALRPAADAAVLRQRRRIDRPECDQVRARHESSRYSNDSS